VGLLDEAENVMREGKFVPSPVAENALEMALELGCDWAKREVLRRSLSMEKGELPDDPFAGPKPVSGMSRGGEES